LIILKAIHRQTFNQVGYQNLRLILIRFYFVNQDLGFDLAHFQKYIFVKAHHLRVDASHYLFLFWQAAEINDSSKCLYRSFSGQLEAIKNVGNNVSIFILSFLKGIFSHMCKPDVESGVQISHRRG
jgi:hypothetical protein